MDPVLLRDLVEDLVLPVERTAIVDAYRVRDLLDARIAVAVGAYEAVGGHELDGSVTMPAWLRHHTGTDPAGATRDTIRARKLRALPVLTSAFLSGELTGGKVDIILAHVRLRHLDLFASHETALVPRLVPLTVDQASQAMADWRAKAEALDEAKPPPEHPNQVHLSDTIDSRGELRGSLDADLNAIVKAAFRLADPKDLDLSLAQRRAEALGQICQHFLDHQQIRAGGRHRPHLNVVMTYEHWADEQFPTGARYLDTGHPVSPATLGQLRCDGAHHRLLAGRSGILDYGRATRQWPTDIYNAIVARDQGCRWPGCTAPASWTDVHHVDWWERGGTTSLDNGVLLCRRHHRKLHAGTGWEAKLLPDATLEITHPDGRVESSEPRGPIAEQFWRQPPDGG